VGYSPHFTLSNVLYSASALKYQFKQHYASPAGGSFLLHPWTTTVSHHPTAEKFIAQAPKISNRSMKCPALIAKSMIGNMKAGEQ
jgi:hypothetical protein